MDGDDHLGDLSRVDTHLGAGAVEADVVGDERVHDLEVDLEGTLVELARLAEVAAELRKLQRPQVDRLQVRPPGVDLRAALGPDALEVLEEARQVLHHPARPFADLPLVRHVDRDGVGVRPGDPLVIPRPGGSGSDSAASWVPQE